MEDLRRFARGTSTHQAHLEGGDCSSDGGGRPQEAVPVVIATWPWVVLAGLGALHGLNPSMGWLLAVPLGLHRARGLSTTRLRCR